MIIHNKQPNNTEYLCNTCSEAVTNPICPFCLTEEIKAWLTLYPALRQELIPRIYIFLNNISSHIDSYGTNCIKCQESRAHVCPYCFTNFVFNQLQKINVPTNTLKEFFEFFNFDLEHTGYTTEAEELGIY